MLKEQHNIVVKEVDFKPRQDKYDEYQGIPKIEAVLKILTDSEIPLRERPESAILQVLGEKYREHIMPSPVIKNDVARDAYKVAKYLMTPTLLHTKGYNIIDNRVSLLTFLNPKKELTIVLDKNTHPLHREGVLVEELKHVHQLRGLNAIKTAAQGGIETLEDGLSFITGKPYNRYEDPHAIEGIHFRKEEFEPELKKYGYTADEDKFPEYMYFDPDTYN